jgi:hypothetical protein
MQEFAWELISLTVAMSRIYAAERPDISRRWLPPISAALSSVFYCLCLLVSLTNFVSLTQISTSSLFLSLTSASAQQPDGSFGSPLLSEAELHPELPASTTAPSPLGAGESYLPTTLVLFLLLLEYALKVRMYRRA